MNDFEQLYYDLLRKYRKERKENELLKEQIKIYNDINKNSNLKIEIIKMFQKYKNN